MGTYANIAITVIAGSLSAQLAPFTVTVSDSASATGTGTATLSWTAPTQNTDDSALTDLAGFRVYYGSSAFGVESAAEAYFGKHVNELDLAQCALLAGLPRAPHA